MRSSSREKGRAWLKPDPAGREPWLTTIAYLLPILGVLVGAILFPIDSPLAADTEYYFFVGRHFLDGLGLTDVDGSFFAAHGPLGPITWALISEASAGSNIGPRVLGYVALATGLLITVRIAQRIGGSRAALCTALALLFIPFFWETLGQLYLDQVQFALTTGALLLLFSPERNRFVAAGVTLGLAILFKETSALVALAPLGWLGTIHWRNFARLYLYFLVPLLVVVAWWWILVWINAEVIFPFNRFESAVGVVYLGTQWLVVIGCVVAAALFLLFERRRPESRILLIGWLVMLPPVAITLANHLAARQLIIWSALSAVFAGAVASRLSSRLLLAVVAVAVVGIGFQANQFRPAPLTSPEFQELSRYLRESHPETEITAMWRGNRRIASNAGNVYFTELLSVSNCPCDGRDLAKSEVPEQLASTRNEILVLIRAERLARYLTEKFPRTYSIIWNSRREKVDVLRVQRDQLPTAARMRRALENFRQHLTNLRSPYNPAVNIKPFPFGSDGWEGR